MNKTPPQNGETLQETGETLQETGETPPQTSETPPQTDEVPPQVSPERKKPTARIAVLTSICVVVLGISIWGLVASLTPGNATLAANERPSSNTAAGRDSNTSTQANSTDSTRDDRPQSEGSSQDATGSEDAAGAGGSTTGGTTGSGSSQDAGGSTNQGTGGSTNPGQGDGAPANPGGNVAPQSINVTLSINCSVAIEAGSATAKAVSDNGAMRYATLRLNAGTSVYDALVASGAGLSTQGSPGSPLGIYVSAIDGLSQGEAGPQSGWKYYVNGTAPGMSCDRYTLTNGDVIEWRYVTNA